MRATWQGWNWLNLPAAKPPTLRRAAA